VNHNRIVADDLTLHPAWDFNSNERALEVIGDLGSPVFQMIFEPPNRLSVLGVFPFPNDEVLIQDTEGGYPAFFDAKTDEHSFRMLALKTKPLFKYPSWKYPGQFAQ